MRGEAASTNKGILGKSELKSGKLAFSPLAQPPKLVYIRYRDHVLFRNADPNLYQPCIRECVGWIVKENEEAVWLVWERPVNVLPYEKSTAKESGLVILKADIIQLNTFCGYNRECRVCVSEPRGEKLGLKKRGGKKNESSL